MKDGGAWGVFFGVLFLGTVLVIIGMWYLLVLALAAIVFLVLWAISRRQHRSTREILRFRPGQLVPAEVWGKAQGLPTAAGSEVADIDLVGLDDYSDNWAQFRSIAEVDRAGSVTVRAVAIAYQTPTADRGVVFAYERMILGRVRAIELEHYFDAMWSRGGILQIAITATFDSSGQVSSASAHLPMYLDSEGGLRPHEKAAWRMIWGGVRGRDNGG